MGLFDNVIVLEEPLTCPDGHSLRGLQTKSFGDPSMHAPGCTFWWTTTRSPSLIARFGAPGKGRVAVEKALARW